MTKNNYIHIRCDDKLKQAFKSVMTEKGLTISEGLIAYMKQVTNEPTIEAIQPPKQVEPMQAPEKKKEPLKRPIVTQNVAMVKDSDGVWRRK